jgi:triosephosphate isomerase (TIM)
MRARIIAGNWKMNTDLEEALELAGSLKKTIDKTFPANFHIIIAPPFPFLNPVKNVLEGSLIKVAAQDCSSEEKGAFTGEVSASMLRSSGAEYVIIGHSERRTYFKESAETLIKKLQQCLKQKLKPIFCIGENLEERQKGLHFATVEGQLNDVLGKFTESELQNFIIAYEPVWAIGTGQTANSEQITEMHGHIRNFITGKCGNEVSENISILYGGSCNEKNASEIFACKDVDGGLIGGASLKEKSFFEIINCGLIA